MIFQSIGARILFIAFVAFIGHYWILFEKGYRQNEKRKRMKKNAVILLVSFSQVSFLSVSLFCRCRFFAGVIFSQVSFLSVTFLRRCRFVDVVFLLAILLTFLEPNRGVWGKIEGVSQQGSIVRAENIQLSERFRMPHGDISRRLSRLDQALSKILAKTSCSRKWSIMAQKTVFTNPRKKKIEMVAVDIH